VNPGRARSGFGMRGRFGLLACLLGCALSAQAAPADPFFDKLLTLGTGTEGGAFALIGQSLCEAVNQRRPGIGIRCVAPPTAGSAYNLNALNQGRLQLGLTQEDLLREHLNGNRGPGFEGLRVVAVSHQSALTVLVRADLPAQQLGQIKGLRVNVGNRGSGQYAAFLAMIKALGLAESDFPKILTEPTPAFDRLFCGGEVDVLVEMLPHPSAVVRNMLACGGRLLSIPPEVSRQLVASNDVMTPYTIAAGSYPKQSQPVSSVGVRNLVVSHERVSPESVSRFLDAVVHQFGELKQAQPLLTSMPAVARGPDAAAAIRWPVHEGVMRAWGATASGGSAPAVPSRVAP
jgi:uncharacterized protein